MATEKWIAGSGVGFTWTSAFAAGDLTVASFLNGDSLLSSASDITNQTALDIFCDFSIALGSAIFAAPNYIGVYLYPLNQDGTTYGDGAFTAGTVSTSVPSPTYYKGSIIIRATTAAQQGTLTGIIMPPGSFRFLIQNQSGATLATSGNAYKYRTYNRSVA